MVIEQQQQQELGSAEEHRVTSGEYLSPEAYGQLGAQEYGDEAYFAYLSQITKSVMGFSVISQITPWTDDRGKIVRHSPFTARTVRAFLKLILNVIDRAEYLQNLSSPSDQRKADLWFNMLFNMLQSEVNRIDTEKPEFYTTLENIKKHSWTIRTRAVGYDRERILQARKIIEQILKSGSIPLTGPNKPKGVLDAILGR
jgi:hypothetical protein